MSDPRIEVSDVAHPYHTSNVSLWRECHLAFRGGKEFIEYVISRHQLELDDDFYIRKKRAFYLNFVKRIVNTMTDIIFDNMIVRPTIDKYKVLKPFYKKASFYGESYETFIRRVSKLSSVFGWVVVAVDFFGTKVPTLADVENGVAYPRLRLFTPLEFVDWQRNGDGFKYGVVKREVYVKEDPDNPFSETKNIDEYILYTDKEVVVIREDVISARYKHNLGFAPLILVNDSTVDEFGFSEPLIKDASRIAATIVNWSSVLDEVFSRQTLSQLVYPNEGSIEEEAARLLDRSNIQGQISNLDDLANFEKLVLKKIGTAKVFTYPANAGHPPQYISPPASDMRIGWEIIMQLAQVMFFLVGLGSVREDIYTASSKARESALSLMKSYLKDKANNLQTAEENILQTFFAYMPPSICPASIEVKYPAEIDPGPYIDFFNATVQSLIKPNISTEFNKAILKKLVDKCPYLTDEEKSVIKDEIDASSGIFNIPK